LVDKHQQINYSKMLHNANQSAKSNAKDY